MVPKSDEVPANVRTADDEAGWEEVEFDDKPTAKPTVKPATPVAMPIDDEDAPMAELAEPLSPADFAAKQALSKQDSGEVKSVEFAEPLSPGDFAFEHKKPDPKDEPLSPADFAVRKNESSGSKKAKTAPPPPAAVKAQPVQEAEVAVPLEIQDEAADGRGFRLDQTSLRKVYLLAIVEAFVTVIIALPALEHVGLFGAPPWAIVLLGVVALQTLYMLWVVALPDWSTVWFGSLVFGLTCVVHLVGLVLSFILADKNFLGLSTANWGTPLWCAMVMVGSGAMAFGCIHISRPWREDYEAYKASMAR